MIGITRQSIDIRKHLGRSLLLSGQGLGECRDPSWTLNVVRVLLGVFGGRIFADLVEAGLFGTVESIR